MTHGQFEAFLRARPSALFVEPIDVAQPSLPSGLGTTRPIITTTPDLEDPHRSGIRDDGVVR